VPGIVQVTPVGTKFLRAVNRVTTAAGQPADTEEVRYRVVRPGPTTWAPLQVTRMRAIVAISEGYPMSQRILTMTCWDVMDRVFVTARVREYDGNDPTAGETVLDRSTTVEGTGEDDVEEWVRDALVAMIETL